MLAANVAVPFLWKSGGVRLPEDGEKDPRIEATATTGDPTLLQAWRICLVVPAVWTMGLALTSPGPWVVSMTLAATGAFFAIGNWVPNALVSHEIAARTAAVSLADGLGDEPESDTAMLLALHNMSITVPQILSSVASAALFALAGWMDMPADVSWVFVMACPAAVVAAVIT